MKSIVIFYNESNCSYKNEKIFGGKSAVQKAREVFESDVFENGNYSAVCGIFTIEKKTCITELLNAINEISAREKADFVIFSFDDLPFLDAELTKKLIQTHIEYKAEYTFADGYPYGFTPEIIDCGTLRILEQLTKTTQEEFGKSEVTRDWLYNTIKTDINSFEVESVLAPEDWRLYRFAFHCGKKENYLQCKALENAKNDTTMTDTNVLDTTMTDTNVLKNDPKNNTTMSVINSSKKMGTADHLSELASKTLFCLKTVPAFYNIQIADKVHSNCVYLPYNKCYEEVHKITPLNATTLMSYDNFATLVEKIVTFSEQAVISLSAWGEPLENPDCLKMIEKALSYEGISVFLETDGLLVTKEFCDSLEKIVKNAKPRTNGWQKIMIAISLDSMTSKTYVAIHNQLKEENFQTAVNAISNLQKVIPGCVYPQFVRMNENEAELEAFYRYWNEKTNPSAGNLIIQKYDDFAGLLPQCKPADLAPLERNPCWHTRRDMTILSNGDVPCCRQYILSGMIGNVFVDDLETIWHKTDEILNQHINKKYLKKCEKCDEYYTFNF